MYTSRSAARQGLPTFKKTSNGGQNRPQADIAVHRHNFRISEKVLPPGQIKPGNTQAKQSFQGFPHVLRGRDVPTVSASPTRSCTQMADPRRV